jgi:hypothetical protein
MHAEFLAKRVDEMLRLKSASRQGMIMWTGFSKRGSFELASPSKSIQDGSIRSVVWLFRNSSI